MNDSASSGEKKEIARRLFYGAGFRLGSLALSRLLSVARVFVFARLFLPDMLGMVALAQASVAIVASFADLGFLPNVIRQRLESIGFVNTSFTLSLLAGLAAAVVILIGAPVFSLIFETDMDAYVRFLAIVAMSIPMTFPRVFWERELRYGHPSAVVVVREGTIIAVAVFAELAFQFGIWSLLIGYVTGNIVHGAYIWLLSPKRPGLGVEKEHVQPILQFGVPYMLRGVNASAISRGDRLIVGKFAGTEQLAYYNFAWAIPLVMSSLVSALDSMLLPVYARFNDSRDDLRRLFNLANKMYSLVGSLFGFGTLLYAEEIVLLLYGPKWQPVIPILRIMSILFIVRFCTGYAYENLVLLRGRTAYMFKWSLVTVALVFTVGALMIKEMGPIGGAWFWLGQAIIFIPLVRIRLILDELATLEFLWHIWQPLVSGLVSAGIVTIWRTVTPLAGAFDLTISVALYLITFTAALVLLDRTLIGSVRRLLQLAGS